MHTANNIATEIVELKAILSAYNHFLASHEAKCNVECTTLVRNNRAIALANLKLLSSELEGAHQAKVSNQKERAPQLEIVNYKWSDLEERAIIHFNKDKRFAITE